MRVLVLGFYDRRNFGDDLFRYIFQKYLSLNQLVSYKFTNIDDFDCTSQENDYNLIIVGGGDVINDYFFKEDFCQFLQNSQAVKLAISVGIPYESCIRYLDLFDHVMLRSPTDYDLVCERLTAEHVSVFPDMSIILQKETDIQATNIYVDTSLKPGFRIGVFPAQPLFAKNKCQLEMNFADALVTILRSNTKAILVFIPMNTNSNNSLEDDNVAIENILSCIPPEFYNRIECFDGEWTESKYFETLATLDLSICMRFHSVMLSLIFKVPMVTTYCQRKIHNLLQEFSLLEDSYRIPTDDNDVPIKFDIDAFSQVYDNVFDCYQQRLTCLIGILPHESHIINAIERLLRRPRYRKIGRKYISAEFILQKTNSVIQTLATQQEKVLQISKELYTKLIIFETTRQASSQYYYGLLGNMKRDDFNLYENVKWLVEDYYSKYIHHTGLANSISLKKIVKFNMNYMNQTDFAGVHRSGWSFVTQGLLQLNSDDPSCVLLDTYLDRTFHWAQDLLALKNIIPYKKAWVGFIHHTFLDNYTPYSTGKLFQNPLFVESLKTCRGIFTLSQNLATQVSYALKNIGFGHIKVDYLCHPTEIVENKFEVEKFLNNRDRKIIQIGGWMRNPWGIYELDTSPKFRLQKTVLVGKHMQNYTKPPKFDYNLRLFIQLLDRHKDGNCNVVSDLFQISGIHCQTNESDESDESDPVISNIFLRKFYEDIRSKLDSVVQIPEKVNEEYDDLLTRNVVFLNLYDASAVNTVIECIVRNTPIVVNRHPSLEEVLGKGYPLFYSDIDEAQFLLESSYKIQEANEYLECLDKSPFHIRYFLNDFQAKLINMLY